MPRAYLVTAMLVCSAIYSAAAERVRLDLDGTWQFRTDPQSVGVREEWHSPGVPFPQQVQVPGSWQAQGIGEPDGILRHNYSGPAWYRRQVNIPASWQGKVIRLRLGGALRVTTVYVNGRRVGEHDGFSTPFDFDISAFVHPGTENTIAIRIVNPAGDVRASPDVQVSSQPTGMMNYIGSWGGIYGNLVLEAAPASSLGEIVVTPEIAQERALFAVSLSGAPLDAASVEIAAGDYHVTKTLPAGNIREFQIVLPMPGVHLWSPDSPFLYTATIRLVQNGREIDRVQQRFGMREITTRGRVLLLNGKPLYLRGYGDDNVEVLTGVPPASKQAMLDRVKLARSFGFNAVRFHSMVPSEPFFEAADEAGLLVMAELPAAYTMHFLPHREYLKSELESTLRAYRNHPSFLSLAFGNEFNLNWLKSPEEKKEFQSTVDDFYRFAKSIDPHRLILSNDGLLLRPSDMFSTSSGAPADAPTVRHEFGEYYCSLPDISLIPKFTGVVQPTWLEEKQKWVERNGLQTTYSTFLRNSEKLQQIGRKFQIERVRKSSEVSGYEYWLITDYPGGTGEGDSWEEGWFDYFWRPKGIVPREGQEINAPVLLLTDADVDKRTLWNDEPRRVRFTISNYGDAAIQNGTLTWTLNGPAGPAANGTVKNINVELGAVAPVGEIEIPPVGGAAAQKFQLVAEIASAGQSFENRWDFWFFPHPDLLKSTPIEVVSDVRWHALQRSYPFLRQRTDDLALGSLLITEKLDPKALAFLKTGGRVWLMAGEAQFRRPGDATFFPASGGALGSVILDHPALRGFPQDGTFDLQFFNLLQGAWNFSLDRWPQELRPIAGSIRTTSSFLSKSKKLSRTGYIFEARVGQGSLLVSTLRIKQNFDESYPEAMFLFDRLVRYTTGKEFNPQIEVAEERLGELAAE